MEWVLVDDLDASVPATGQMARDTAMLESVLADGVPIVRVYRWPAPALTIGRHQPETDIDAARCAAAGVEVVRRPTGGRALLHGGDLTYAVAMPVPDDRTGVLASYAYIADALIAGLASVGIDAAIARRSGARGSACFASHEGADLAVAGRKVCGSAQVQRNGVLLQHGAILLERLAYDETAFLAYSDAAQRRIEAARLADATVTLGELGGPTDPRLVADAVVAGFAAALGVTFRRTRATVATA